MGRMSRKPSWKRNWLEMASSTSSSTVSTKFGSNVMYSFAYLVISATNQNRRRGGKVKCDNCQTKEAFRRRRGWNENQCLRARTLCVVPHQQLCKLGTTTNGNVEQQMHKRGTKVHPAPTCIRYSKCAGAY